MNIHFKDIGFGLMLSLVLLGCQTSNRSNTYRDGKDDQPIVEEKYSLKADREKIESLRNETGPAAKVENDQWALILRDMSSGSKPPSDVREKYYSLVRKQRERFNKDLQKEREVFTEGERRARADFLKGIAEKRSSYLADKPSRDQRQRFLSNLDTERSEFMSTERDRRADFESDVRERRKNFDDYIKERTSTFDQELKAYNQRLKDAEAEKKKAEKEQLEKQGQ